MAPISGVVLFLGLLGPARGVRETIAEDSKLGYSEGDVFEGFRLESHVGHAPLARDTAGVGSSFLEGELQQNHTAAGPLVPFPKVMQSRFGPNPKNLGAGSFGEAWLATGTAGTPFEGRMVVLKILYIKEGKKYLHVTRAMTAKNKILSREVAGTARECNYAMDLQKAAHKMGEYGKYAQRIMGCYAHNFKIATGKAVPIYLVLENCGANDLEAYIKNNRKTFDSAHLASIVRQITEGLLYLSKQDPPMVHHDLKPANIVVKETSTGFPTVHLIDLGGMLKATTKTQFTSKTVSTLAFAPPEWSYRVAFQLPSYAFDMYAVGNTLADMAIGRPFSSMYSDEQQEPNWHKLNSLAEMQSRSEFVSLYGSVATKKGCAGLSAMAEDPVAYDFIVDYWVKMIRHNPARRPSPEDVLKSQWLDAAASPTNPDWEMWQNAPVPPKVMPEVGDGDNQTEAQQEQDGLEATDEEDFVSHPEVPAGFQGCIKFCDTCDAGGRNEFTKKRQTMYCGIESENLKEYDPDNHFFRVGPAPEFCDKSPKTETIGRNLHGRDGPQTYYIWKCGKTTEAEAKAWATEAEAKALARK